MTDWDEKAGKYMLNCSCSLSFPCGCGVAYIAGVRAGMERAAEIVAPGASIHPLMAGALDTIRDAMPKGEA